LAIASRVAWRTSARVKRAGHRGALGVHLAGHRQVAGGVGLHVLALHAAGGLHRGVEPGGFTRDGLHAAGKGGARQQQGGEGDGGVEFFMMFSLAMG
jgi:hypothetical protein